MRGTGFSFHCSYPLYKWLTVNIEVILQPLQEQRGEGTEERGKGWSILRHSGVTGTSRRTPEGEPRPDQHTNLRFRAVLSHSPAL